MKENDLEFLRQRLIEVREDIFCRMRDLENGWQTLSEHDIEMSEEAQKAEITELYGRLDEKELAQVEEIDRALSKMAVATYGVCEECGRAITLARLRALPTTRYCVDCSRKMAEAGSSVTAGD